MMKQNELLQQQLGQCKRDSAAAAAAAGNGRGSSSRNSHDDAKILQIITSMCRELHAMFESLGDEWSSEDERKEVGMMYDALALTSNLKYILEAHKFHPSNKEVCNIA